MEQKKHIISHFFCINKQSFFFGKKWRCNISLAQKKAALATEVA